MIGVGWVVVGGGAGPLGCTLATPLPMCRTHLCIVHRVNDIAEIRALQ